MKTRKPISTISYNTREFLTLKLEELRKAKIVSVWFFIAHKAEQDELKDHIHLWIMPSKQIQTDDLGDEFIEFVAGSDRPLKCLHFDSSKFEDWYLYSIHDPTYLAKKGQKREFHYKKQDFYCSDPDELETMTHEINLTEGTPMALIVDAIEQGTTFDELVRRGSVPVQQFSQWYSAFDFLSGGFLSRNGRTTHTPAPAPSPSLVDPQTGEVLDSD